MCSCRLSKSLYSQRDYYLKARLPFLSRAKAKLVDCDQYRAQKFDFNSLIIILFFWETEQLGKVSSLTYILQKGRKMCKNHFKFQEFFDFSKNIYVQIRHIYQPVIQRDAISDGGEHKVLITLKC